MTHRSFPEDLSYSERISEKKSPRQQERPKQGLTTRKKAYVGGTDQQHGQSREGHSEMSEDEPGDKSLLATEQ